MKHVLKSALGILLLSTTSVFAGEPVVVDVTSTHRPSGWQFNVSLQHADEGWEHYADGWGVYTLDGVELGYRILAHPHVNEQPFTRSLSGVQIPEGIALVIIRPHDLVHGEGSDFLVDLQ